MINYKIAINIFLIISLLSFFFSLNIEEELLKSDSLYDKGSYNKSFSTIKRIYKDNDNNADVVSRLARSIFLKAMLEQNYKKKKQYYYRGFKEAKKALSLDPNNGYANFWYAAYLGQIGQLEGAKQAILNSYEVKKYALLSIDLEPNYDSPYHMMGRWHYELASLSEFERKAAAIVYAKLPDASYSSAISFFNKAIELKPNEIRHHFWLAETYYAEGMHDLSREEFNIVISLPSKDSDDDAMKLSAREKIKSF